MSRECPLCHRPFKPEQAHPSVLPRLERIGAEWTEFSVGCSRWYRGKLARRYPGWEFRHEPINLMGDLFRIEARRR